MPSDVEDIYKDFVKEKNQHIYDDVFEKLSDYDSIALSSTGNNYAYTNPYHLLSKDTLIREDNQKEFRVEDEYIFTCVATNCATKEIEAFYVTRQYNTLDSAKGRYIAGRFVFRGDRKEELTLIALAEEPVKVLYGDFDSQVKLERYYLDLRKNEPAGKISLWEELA